MASDVTMPRLSDSMEEGTVLKWLVEEGAEVKRGEPLVEIETDKANMTYDADTDGVLVEIVAQEGDTLEIGEVIARIGDASEAKGDGGGEADDEAEAGSDEAEEGEAEGGDEEGAEEAEESGDEGEPAEEEREPAAAEGEDEAEGAGEDEAEAEGAGEDEAEAEGAGDGDAEGEDSGEAEAEADSGEAEAEDSGEAEGDGGGEAEADGDGETEGDEAAAAAEGDEAARAGAEGGGGETQAGTGTATREKTSGGNGDGRVKASPVARRMARDLGVELAQLEGTGPGGRIVKADVQAAAENGGGKAEAPAKGEAETAEEPSGDGKKAEASAKEKPKEKKDGKKAKAKDEKKKDDKEPKKEAQKSEAGVKGDVQVEELTRLQQTVSRRMAESKATAPEFSIALTVDMTAAVELRTRLKEISDPVPSFNDMVVKASANALREHPRVNGAYRDGKFELYDRVNVGIAVAAMDALVVPTIFDADKKSLGQIARDARAVIGKVKDKTVTPPELSGGTFTVSNLGMFGIEQFTAIINPPQAAILTVGKLDKQPAVDDKGKVVARDQMVLTLVCDHRILYGADGAQFLARVKDLLEQPLSLSL
jgi:pyruvate dehydrogenase E2 component (dihydrolipoamide acetyltransferase)